MACNDQTTIFLALYSKTACHTCTEYNHAPPLFLCLVSFLSHFGESWNLCSVVGVGLNYQLAWPCTVQVHVSSHWKSALVGLPPARSSEMLPSLLCPFQPLRNMRTCETAEDSAHFGRTERTPPGLLQRPRWRRWRTQDLSQLLELHHPKVCAATTKHQTTRNARGTLKTGLGMQLSFSNTCRKDVYIVLLSMFVFGFWNWLKSRSGVGWS